jgi:hypothetical protein
MLLLLVQAILSGPAGGVVGYALTTFGVETQQPVSDRALDQQGFTALSKT